MRLFLNRPQYSYEMENVCRLFFPHEKFEKFYENPDDNYDISCNFTCDNEQTVVAVQVFFEDERSCFEVCPVAGDQREEEISMARCLFELLSKHTNYIPQWGVLTGVRPGKLYSSLFEQFGTHEQVKEYMGNRLLVSHDKIELCYSTYLAECRAAALCDASAFSLYVSIPFCPTRCSYCSFVSHSVEKTAKMVPQYVDLLCKELEETAKRAKDLNLTLKTIYFGGGTPTQLSAPQLDQIMTAIEQYFDLSQVEEYTVEGGRPDTITVEKLQVLKKHGVGRLSINPQTIHDNILEIIGRRHSSQQVLDAFQMARDAGFININMDLIAGLPGDTVEGFAQSLDTIMTLSPENITVHTLSVKRSSFLTSRGEIATTPNGEAVLAMLELAKNRLTSNNYSPYYLYRQSKMLGNLENVGWSKPGYDCIYNIYMMNELHTVLAVGAGGVSRLKDPKGTQIERIFNFKYPYEYIERFETMLERKKGIDDFYERYPVS